jgi:hypothetical protein
MTIFKRYTGWDTNSGNKRHGKGRRIDGLELYNVMVLKN